MPGFCRAPVHLIPAPGLPIRVAADDDTGLCGYGCEHLGICEPCLKIVGIATSQCRHGLCQKRCMMPAGHAAAAWHYCQAHRLSAAESIASGAGTGSDAGIAKVKSALLEPDGRAKSEYETADAEEPGEEDDAQPDTPGQAHAFAIAKRKTKKTARPNKRRRMENWDAGLTGAGKPRHQ